MRRIQQNIIINVLYRSLCKVPVILVGVLMKIEFSRQIFKPIFMKILPVGAELFHADGRTDKSGECGSHLPLLTVRSSVKGSCHALSNRTGFKWNILYVAIKILIITK